MYAKACPKAVCVSMAMKLSDLYIVSMDSMIIVWPLLDSWKLRRKLYFNE